MDAHETPHQPPMPSLTKSNQTKLSVSNSGVTDSTSAVPPNTTPKPFSPTTDQSHSRDRTQINSSIHETGISNSKRKPYQLKPGKLNQSRERNSNSKPKNRSSLKISYTKLKVLRFIHSEVTRVKYKVTRVNL